MYSSVRGASVDESLPCCLYWRELTPDQGAVNAMASKGKEGSILWVLGLSASKRVSITSVVESVCALQRLEISSEGVKISHPPDIPDFEKLIFSI